ncbi:hypothetical protein [Mycobacteroides abscessus]|uniref:Phage-like protein n=1 Tax=Mycobacteroides abscessus TaxID=36809 RepID=A0ABD7HI99_9MYCO|nr:hypothetical protein [Mycobacteroides abscessus]RIR09373.1 hypothetical protein D2E27_19200 [Mycobacteroides abscessus]RIS08475.1 hypothetical protein D2E58_03200 [Mycobacteroides abscessus]RIT32740.1 hypothetical protein D2E76_23305 [Mycobacteroides abscessus]
MAIVGQYALCVQDAEGTFHSFLPGQQVPAWVVALVTNPRAFVAEPADEGEEPAAGDDGQPTSSDPAAASEGATPENPGDTSLDADDQGGTAAPAPIALTAPPHAGVGSGRDAWADYASASGVAVQDDWKRDQIIEACRQAGVAV